MNTNSKPVLVGNWNGQAYISRSDAEFIQKTAQNYAKETKLPLDGYAIMTTNPAEVCAWTSSLRQPKDWRPGAIAVRLYGDQKLHIATDGDTHGGAVAWLPVHIED